MEPLLLASSSPRREEILHMLSIPFVSLHPDIDENLCDHLPVHERVVELASMKAEFGLNEYNPQIGFIQTSPPIRFILAADTLVELALGQNESLILGKPSNIDEAIEMLELIQGREQFVHTGICIIDIESSKKYLAASKSTVHFSPMKDREIREYALKGEWLGAAGAYRIQGWGSCYINRIDGSHSGVMGLPIRELYGILSLAGYDYS
jgi:septum formation protein